jgi:hypothetical protein
LAINIDATDAEINNFFIFVSTCLKLNSRRVYGKDITFL